MPEGVAHGHTKPAGGLPFVLGRPAPFAPLRINIPRAAGSDFRRAIAGGFSRRKTKHPATRACSNPDQDQEHGGGFPQGLDRLLMPVFQTLSLWWQRPRNQNREMTSKLEKRGPCPEPSPGTSKSLEDSGFVSLPSASRTVDPFTRVSICKQVSNREGSETKIAPGLPSRQDARLKKSPVLARSAVDDGWEPKTGQCAFRKQVPPMALGEAVILWTCTLPFYAG